MADKILAKTDLGVFFDNLKGQYQIYAPQENDGRIDWAPLAEANNLLWEFSNSHMSPKDYFFPQTECMMRFKNDQDETGGMIMQAEPLLNEKRVLFNMRPCDAKAFGVLDMIFCQDDYTDDLYWRDKREKSVIISLACKEPCPTCFCAALNSGPHATAGSDIMLVDLDDSVLVKGVTEKGVGLIQDLDEASGGAVDSARAQKEAAEEMISGGVVMDNVEAREVLELFELPMWQRVAENCLNCGTCTFCCPTCHCFDIQDETQGKQGRRVRNWDHCMSWLFTVHTTGHNPRNGKMERVRQRFMHKFKYIPMKRKGEIGCVGCGRCVQLCPVNIDVRAVVKQMNA